MRFGDAHGWDGTTDGGELRPGRTLVRLSSRHPLLAVDDMAILDPGPFLQLVLSIPGIDTLESKDWCVPFPGVVLAGL